jgi:hypothetical protein
MDSKFRPLPKEERKNILLLCDDIRMHSGVATMAREFVVGTAHHFNWYNLGAAVTHPEEGKIFDLSNDVNKKQGLSDANVMVQPNSGYGNADIVRKLIKEQKPDAIFIFTDPRYWVWLFEIEREIRSQIPIMWLNIWDEYPAPMYNKVYYNSVDVLMAISKQTLNINRIVLGKQAEGKVLEYVPHGIDHNMFFPILRGTGEYKSLMEFKLKTIPVSNVEFVVFFNSRNIQRKHPADLILAYRLFCDQIGKEAAKKCALILHTTSKDPNGTDLNAVKEALTDPEYVNIFFSQGKLSSQQMNLLYNISDLTVLPSSNEGWGLSLTESMMTGTMIAANVTGGMQDQMRFENDKGEWIDFSSDFPSNHRGTYKKCGVWAEPIFPSNISLAGSVPTPYIFDDKCDLEDIATAILNVYTLDPEERSRRGMKGREWATSNEAQMTSELMSNNIIKVMDQGFESFEPRPAFDLIKVDTLESNYITHKLTGY